MWPFVSGESPMFKRHLRCGMYHAPFLAIAPRHFIVCIDHSSFSIHHLGCFHFLTMRNDAAGNIHIHVFVWVCFSFLLSICLGLKLPGHVISMFNVSMIRPTIFQRCHPTLPATKGSSFPRPCQHLLLLVFFIQSSYVRSHGSGFYFPNDYCC